MGFECVYRVYSSYTITGLLACFSDIFRNLHGSNCFYIDLWVAFIKQKKTKFKDPPLKKNKKQAENHNAGWVETPDPTRGVGGGRWASGLPVGEATAGFGGTGVTFAWTGPQGQPDLRENPRLTVTHRTGSHRQTCHQHCCCFSGLLCGNLTIRTEAVVASLSALGSTCKEWQLSYTHLYTSLYMHLYL